MLLTIHWCYSQFIHWCYFLVLFIGATHEVSLVLLLTIHWCYLRFIHWCYSRSFIGAATHNLLAIACVVVKKNEASNTLCGQTQQEIQPPSHTNTHTLQSHAAVTPTRCSHLLPHTHTHTLQAPAASHPHPHAAVTRCSHTHTLQSPAASHPHPHAAVTRCSHTLQSHPHAAPTRCSHPPPHTHTHTLQPHAAVTHCSHTHTLQSHAAPTPTATYLNEGVRKRFHFFPPWTAFHRNPSPLVKIPRGRRVPIATTVDVITNTAAAAAAAAATAFCRHDIRLLPRMLGAASVYSA